MEKKNRAIALALCGAGIAVGCAYLCTPLKASAYSGSDGVSIYPQKYTWLVGAEMVVSTIDTNGNVNNESSLPMPNCIYKNNLSSDFDEYTNRTDLDGQTYPTFTNIALSTSNKLYTSVYGTDYMSIKSFATTITTLPNQIVTQSFFDSLGRTYIYYGGVNAPNSPHSTLDMGVERSKVVTTRLELWNYTTNVYDVILLEWTDNGANRYNLPISSQEEQIPNIMDYRREIDGTRFYNLKTCELGIQFTYSQAVTGSEENAFFTIYHDTNPSGATVSDVMRVQKKYTPPLITWDGEIPLFNIAESFFSTEIFPGFSLGTVLLFGVGAFIVGIVLKVFLGG